MKLIFKKSDLIQAMNIALRAVPNRTAMPILNCILIDAKDSIQFTTSDTELGASTAVYGKIVEGGTIAVDAKLFSEIVRKLPDEDITFVSDESNKVTISAGKAKFNIQGQRGEDFPFIPTIDRSTSVTMPEATLRKMIRQTIFSIAQTDSGNKLMNGELFEVRDNSLRVVALDGHRIAIRKAKLSGENADVRAVVPGKALAEIIKVLREDSENMVAMYFENAYVMFEFGETTFVSRLLDGEYFDIDRMLTNNYNAKVIVRKDEFSDCIDRATIMARETEKKPIILDIGETSMNVKIQSTMGTMNDTLSIDKSGSDLKIAFNPRFFLDALRAIDEEEISIYLISAKSPCYIRDDEGTYTYLLLPVNFVE